MLLVLTCSWAVVAVWLPLLVSGSQCAKGIILLCSEQVIPGVGGIERGDECLQFSINKQWRPRGCSLSEDLLSPQL